MIELIGCGSICRVGRQQRLGIAELGVLHDVGAPRRGAEADRRLPRIKHRIGGRVAAGVFEAAVLRHRQEALELLDEGRLVDQQLRVEALVAVILGRIRQVVHRRVLLELHPGEPGRGRGDRRRLLRRQSLGRLHQLVVMRGRLLGIEPRLLERVLVVPHDRGRGIERHRGELSVGQRVIAADAGNVGLGIERLPRFLEQLPGLLHRASGGEHRAGADLEHLHDVRRLPGAERGDRRRQRLGIAALVDRGQLDRALARVERFRDRVDHVAVGAAHRVPHHDLGRRGGARLARTAGRRDRRRCRPAGCDASWAFLDLGSDRRLRSGIAAPRQ